MTFVRLLQPTARQATHSRHPLQWRTSRYSRRPTESVSRSTSELERVLSRYKIAYKVAISSISLNSVYSHPSLLFFMASKHCMLSSLQHPLSLYCFLPIFASPQLGHRLTCPARGLSSSMSCFARTSLPSGVIKSKQRLSSGEGVNLRIFKN